MLTSICFDAHDSFFVAFFSAAPHFPGAGSICARHLLNKLAGKPGAWFVRLALEMLDVDDPGDVLMVGDRLDTDIAFGRAAGFKTLLVTETGVHSLAHAEASEPHLRPDYHAPSIARLGKVMGAEEDVAVADCGK